MCTNLNKLDSLNVLFLQSLDESVHHQELYLQKDNLGEPVHKLKSFTCT